MKGIETAIILGSDSDFPKVEDAVTVLKAFGIRHEVRVISAHRSPNRLHRYVQDAEKRGAGVFIGAAGGAAHLPGVIASLTALPVIGIPIHTKTFDGLDSLLSILQMPSGVPVATMAVGKAGAKNAAIFAVQVLALRNARLRKKLREYKRKQEAGVAKKDAALQKRLAPVGK